MVIINSVLMKSQRHLIIGSNSFLGVALSKKIIDHGEEVLGVYHKNINKLNREINHISINKLHELKDEFNVVYIVSAFVPNQYSTVVKQTLDTVNVKLVETICKQFTNAIIVFCSSVSVYGDSEESITEVSELNPLTPYAKSKLLGEKIVKKHDKYRIVRISSMYGETMKPTTFLPLIIQSALSNKKITLFGNGNRLQNYIHVDDVAEYLFASGTTLKNNVFLATSKVSVTNKEVAQYVKRALTQIEVVFTGNDDSKSYIYNNMFTNKLLHLEAKKVLKIEIENLIIWMKNES